MAHSALAVLALTLFTSCMAADKTYYRGAVVDYNVVQNLNDPRANLMANVKNFGDFIKQAAANKSDIIVFPEGALGGSQIFLSVPDPKFNVTPAGNTSWDEALQSLSSFANNSKIYVVVNLHETYTDPAANQTLKYNTNVVFDRNGTVISRYRKFNLFGEALNITKEAEYATFKTDFGVTFGQFICFDILFKEPAFNLVTKHNITNFVYPTMWFSELPFLTAAQAQWSWAVGNNVNLLAAGVNNVGRGSSGSGIYRGKSGYWSSANSVFSNQTAHTLIIANIPKVLSGEPDSSFLEDNFLGSTRVGEKNETFTMMEQPNLKDFASADIPIPTNNSGRINFVRLVCHSKFCCNFDLNITYGPNVTDTMYKAVAFSGDRTFDTMSKSEHGIEICGVYAYRNSTGFSQIAFGPDLGNIRFQSARISGNFRTQNAEILPNVLLRKDGVNDPQLLSPSDVTFKVAGHKAELIWNNANAWSSTITVAIHSRLFKNAADLARVSLFALLLPLLLLFFGITKWY